MGDNDLILKAELLKEISKLLAEVTAPWNGQMIHSDKPIIDYVSHGSYDLLFDDEKHPIVLRCKERDRLLAGEKHRIIGADLKAKCLVRVTPTTYSKMTGYAEIDSFELLVIAFEAVRDFMPNLKREIPPYYGALDELKNRWTLGFEVDPCTHHPKKPQHNHSVYLKLDNDDVALINLWAGDISTPLDVQSANTPLYKRGKPHDRFIYARLAEKMVLEFLSNELAIPASDVSILQIKGGSEAWKTHDISAGSPIDVKNATVYSRRRRHNYARKYKRVGTQDVQIAGVLTQVHRGGDNWFLEGKPSTRQWHYVHQTFLGLVAKRDVELIEHAINGLPNQSTEVRMQFDADRIPPWAFELTQLDIDHALLLKFAGVLARKPETAIALSIACRCVQDTTYYSSMNNNQRDIVSRLELAIAQGQYRKLTFVLFAISEFINAAVAGRHPGAVVRFIKRIITIEDFIAWKLDKNQSVGQPFRWPYTEYEIPIKYSGSKSGGLYDPTNSVDELLSVLEKCGDHIALSDIKFRHFDAPHPHILVGKTTNGRKLTIYTYCGGHYSGGARCDNFPLHIGNQPNCDKCGHLVCDDCGYCSDRCRSASDIQNRF